MNYHVAPHHHSWAYIKCAYDGYESIFCVIFFFLFEKRGDFCVLPLIKQAVHEIPWVEQWLYIAKERWGNTNIYNILFLIIIKKC